MTRPPIYLDYAATTPVDPAVIRAMTDVLGVEFGNPSAVTHDYGRRAAARIERAAAQTAALIGAQPREIIFTSGTTESNNLAILGVARRNADRGRHIVTSRIEHKSVLDPCRELRREGFEVTFVEPDARGVVDPARIESVLRPDTRLVSLQHVNNEIGVIQDIAAIGALCRARNIFFHSDAAQSIARLAVDVSRLDIDALSFSAHKLYGPKGIGALYLRERARPLLGAIMFGGGQGRGLRPGTMPVHQVIGLGVACELATPLLAPEAARQEELARRLWSQLEPLGEIHLNGAGAPRVGGIVNVSIEGVHGEMLMASLEDLALSSGSACDSARGEPSFVLRALGRSPALAESSLRFSFGRQTTAAEVDEAARRTAEVVRSLRARSPARARESQPGDGGPTGRRLRLPGAQPGSRVLSGEAGGPQHEAWVRWQLVVDEHGTVQDALYRSRSCPHTEGALGWLQKRLPGRPLSNLLPDGPLEWARALGVPPEKLGALLVVEDALNACLRHDGDYGDLTD